MNRKDLPYDALLLVSFGGPEGMADVMPFLDNVLRGKNVPEERKREVAHHYELFGGVSPINEQCRLLKKALEAEFAAHRLALPVYWGNRNWAPYLADALAQMKDAGVRRALAFFTSAFSSYSGCRQYRENIADARALVGEGAPEVDRLRMFFNHPGFIQANVDHIRAAYASLSPVAGVATPLVFTAHSLPVAMAERCAYEAQLREACRLVAEAVAPPTWGLVYQSRSGPPSQPWLGPDVCDDLRRLHSEGVRSVVVSPIGFVSDHLEVLFDLDVEAQGLCATLGLHMARAATVGLHPRFVSMVRELVEERCGLRVRSALGALGPSHDACPEDCCLPPPGRPVSG